MTDHLQKNHFTKMLSSARLMLQRLVSVFCLLMAPHLTAAIPTQAEPVILTLKGIKNEPVAMTLSEIKALPTQEIRTETIWTDQAHTFTAVYLETLLNHLEVRQYNRNLTMIALNDYSVDVKLKTLIDNQAFIAFAMDGKQMRIRDKGPLWVLYPYSDRPEINIPPYQSHAIWQLKTMILH